VIAIYYFPHKTAIATSNFTKTAITLSSLHNKTAIALPEFNETAIAYR
jgi:hypothetical protein